MSDLPVGMTKCYDLHLNGMGCSKDNFDPECEECPYNPQTREQIAERIAEEISELGLTEIYGGEVSKETPRNGRSYYGVGFSKRATLDGEIRVYGKGFIMVRYQTTFLALPDNDKRIYKGGWEDVVSFLRLAFVEHKFDEALDIRTSVG